MVTWVAKGHAQVSFMELALDVEVFSATAKGPTSTGHGSPHVPPRKGVGAQAFSIIGRAYKEGTYLPALQTNQCLSLALLRTGSMVGINNGPLFACPLES